MEFIHNPNGSMQYKSMNKVVPPRTSSSSNKNKTQLNGNGKPASRRNLTPINNKKNKANWIKGKKIQQSLNSSWYSKSSNNKSNYSRSSWSSSGTKYSSLSRNQTNKQYQQLCRYWKQSKCNKEGCEFAHYEFKHLNTTYSEHLKMGAQSINHNYAQNIEQGKALVQITSLQYLTIQQIERIMKKTDFYKEEIQIAVINKSAFKRFKKEYKERLNQLDDDSYNKKIQLKIDVFNQQLDQIIKIDKKTPKLNTQQNNNTQQTNNSPPPMMQQSQSAQSTQLKKMEIEQQNQQSAQQQQQQVSKPNKNKQPKEDTAGRKINRMKSIEKDKLQKNINKNAPKSILKNQSETSSLITTNNQVIEKKKKQKISQDKKQEQTPQHNPMIIAQSQNKKGLSQKELMRSEAVAHKVAFISMHHLNKIAVQTARNGGNFPNNVTQRLIPTIMAANTVYQDYLLSMVSLELANINYVADNLKINEELKSQIKGAILIDTVLLYILKLSEKVLLPEATPEERSEKAQSCINNIVLLVTGKVKQILNQSNIQVGQTTNTALAGILMNAYEDEEKRLYTQNYIVNIGTEDEQILIAVETSDAHEIEGEKKKKPKQTQRKTKQE